MILFPFSHSAMEITCKTICRSFPFVFQHLEPSLTSSPLPFTGCETEGQLLGCVGSSPLEGHRTQMQEGSRRSSENSQQLCEPPRSYVTTMAGQIQGGVAPRTFQLSELYQKLPELQFIAVWLYLHNSHKWGLREASAQICGEQCYSYWNDPL